MVIKIICFLALKDKTKLIKMLSGIEYGFSVFLNKLAKKAKAAGLEELKSNLDKQSKEEKKHGKILGSLIYGKTKPSLTNNGFFVKEEDDDYLISRAVKISWNDLTDQKVNALFYCVDGISRLLPSTRFFFNYKEAYNYDWLDVLAIYYIVERKTEAFYKELAKQVDDFPTKMVAEKILQDEKEHSLDALSNLKMFTKFHYLYTIKWEARLFMSIPLILLDLMNIMNTPIKR